MRILILQLAAMGYELWRKSPKAAFWKDLKTSAIDTVFPALTCPVQASFRTGATPENHGMIANGIFDRRLRKPMFWEQSSALYAGKRIWEEFRSGGGTVGQICWQQSLGPDSDLILSPGPIHKHHGGMIQDFHSRPSSLYSDLCRKTGKKFKLHSYWGPLASSASTKWITAASIDLLNTGRAADLQLVYLPHLDYELQKSGPKGKKIPAELAVLDECVSKIVAAARKNGYEIVIFGDYAIESAETALFPNQKLLEKGSFSVRNVKGMLYPDIHSSRAFAMVDHKIAHIYVPNPDDIEKTAETFRGEPGVRNVLTKNQSDDRSVSNEPPRTAYIDHPNSGEIILEAEQGCWFAYHWWSRKSEMPDYATHVDIHNKPGFDPCELFASLWPPMSISTDAAKIGGTHGSTDKPVLLASSFDLGNPANLADLGRTVKNLLAG
ncbi:MAG: alkaline phosphatase family protein [Kiritimatiellaeota bacterium]|nr:alkaline phosphatase family protein [Kiritimatiellota bacterium]